MNPAARKQLIIELINSEILESQEELVKALKKRGVSVTQATASRDLIEIGAYRGRDKSGHIKYLMPTSSNFTSTSSAIGNLGQNTARNLLLSAVPSGNLVVAKTPPGGAQLLAGRIDGAISTGELKMAIGTIAGDDTVIVVSKSSTGGSALARELTTLLDGEPLKSVLKVQRTHQAKPKLAKKRSR
jgi:transcriptional regulator of arginine metabolism